MSWYLKLPINWGLTEREAKRIVRVWDKSRQAAQRTVRPSAPICAGSMMYSLAQDGQTISMANHVSAPLPAVAA